MIKKKFNGLTTIELLVAMTILLTVTFGVSTSIMGKRKLDERNRQLSLLTNLAQKMLNEIVNSSSGKSDDQISPQELFTNYRNLATGNLTKNLNFESLSGFRVGNISSEVGTSTISIKSPTEVLRNFSERNKYVVKFSVSAGDAQIVEAINNGNGCDTTPGLILERKVKIDRNPTSLGILSETNKKVPVSFVSMPSQAVDATDTEKNKSVKSDNVYATKPNLADNSFMISIRCDANSLGQENIKNSYTVGDVIIVKGKEIVVELYYAQSPGSNSISTTNNQPIVKLVTKIPVPI